LNPAEVALQLVAPIYEASLWPEVLNQLARAVEGSTTVFVVHSLSGSPSGNVSVGINIDPSLQNEYDAYYHGVNVHVSKFPAKLSPGVIALSHEYLPDHELQQSEYYNDFLRRLGVFHLIGAVIAQEAGLVSAYSTLRPRQAGPFGDEAAQVFRFLLPHFQRAAKLQNKQARCTPGSNRWTFFRLDSHSPFGRLLSQPFDLVF